MRMRPITKPSSFSIVSATHARRVTGLDDRQLKALPSVQPLVRRFADGRRELAFRLPTELLEDADR
jgi:hypothetical protein